jgi:hypothetical protein
MDAVRVLAVVRDRCIVVAKDAKSEGRTREINGQSRRGRF